MLLSLFCGCGGLDLGFEEAGFKTGLAYDIRPSSVVSWNKNRGDVGRGRVADISDLRLSDMDRDFGSMFAPSGVVGGPPCQSFTRANASRREDDPRSKLVRIFFTLALRLHRQRRELDFIVMENVREIATAKGGQLLKAEIDRLSKSGFFVSVVQLNAVDFGVPQNRHRTFIVALNKQRLSEAGWRHPEPESLKLTVRDAIGRLEEPTYFRPGLDPAAFNSHRNHWCMTPKSKRFFDSSLQPGSSSGRSFKTLAWNEPSIAVSYGHREVHVHPSGKRRLSVWEAMKLQGFPDRYVLHGTLSEQIDQVSEAVPPPLAEAIARSAKAAVIRSKQDQSSEFSAAPTRARAVAA